jgi:tungstate transport system permease protein
MNWFADAAWQALRLIASADPELLRIVTLSLLVSLSATALAGALGVPAGVALALLRLPGRGALVSVCNALMGMPPVVVGLVVFLLLSRRGALGGLELLFTPTAMVIAQTLLVLPIVAALTHAAVMGLDPLLRDTARTLGATRLQAAALVIAEARHGIMAALFAGFGRAIAEVGAVLMVGGNIKGVTRVMTTTIAMQTAMGEDSLALALGMILIGLAVAVNALFYRIQRGPV